MRASNTPVPLRSFFAGLAEQAFETRLGVADPPLVDYLAELLTRFIRLDSMFAIRDLAGRRLQQVGEMLIEAEQRLGEARRDAHQHIGDFTLFWTGVYPEALAHMRGPGRIDYFIDYCEQGKRAYRIASRLPKAKDAGETEVLQRLSHDFELCVYGLAEVRREWERRPGDDAPPPIFVPH